MSSETRRVLGLETEYGLQHWNPEGRPLPAEEVARYLFRPIVEWGRSSNVFMPNAARLYLDVGSHPEYATAECSSLTELIAQDAAGDAMFRELAAQAEDAMSRDGIGGSVHLYRNNVDSAGNSYGSHENYLLRRGTEYRRLAESLVPFLVTRQLLVGAGRVVPGTHPSDAESNTGRAAHFAFSQRADFMEEGVSSATTRARPIINTRDEPHADPSKYRRLHVIVGDSNLAEPTHLLRFGATDLLLRMLEAGRGPRETELRHPRQAIRQISRDLTGRTAIELRSSAVTTALDLQRRYLEHAQRFVDAEGAHHDAVPRVLDLWARTLQAVDSGDFTGIDREIDWAIKHRLLEGYRRRHGLDWDAPRLAQMDLAFHDITRGRGLFSMLREAGQVERVVTDAQIEHAVAHAPSTTRAAVRAAFIARARERGLPYTVDWTHLKLEEHPRHALSLKDPFDTDQTCLDWLFDLIDAPVSGTS